jgi:hypothetical protein
MRLSLEPLIFTASYLILILNISMTGFKIPLLIDLFGPWVDIEHSVPVLPLILLVLLMIDSPISFVIWLLIISLSCIDPLLNIVVFSVPLVVHLFFS